MIKQIAPALFVPLCFYSLITIPCLYAQSSILDQMMRTQNAVVAVKAENNQYFKSPPSKPVLDPHTGRVVVMRNLSRASYERSGSGVIIHPSGIIVTNGHVVAQANYITVTLRDGTSLPAQVVRFVNDLDFALLKIAAPTLLPSVSMANSDEVKLGDEIITIGASPLLDQTISEGKIIGLGTSRSHKTETDLFQTTVNIYRGDSGGPLFDKKGKLIGLMTAKLNSTDHASFAIPANKISLYLQDYLNETKKK